MNNENNYVAIFASGIGSRFWPMSRRAKPKQFLDITGSGQTMLQHTYNRFAKIFPIDHIFVVTQTAYFQNALEDLPDLKRSNILLEPSRKNTAPASAYVAYKLQALNPNANILMTPVDQRIIDENAFSRQVFQALAFSEKKKVIVTLGIKPTSPETNYSYIQYQEKTDHAPFLKLKTVTEKPNIDLARTFLKSGDFLWNSEIFAWRADTIIDTLETYLPEVNELFSQAKESMNTPEEQAVIDHLYPQLTNIPLRYGILDRAQNIYILPCYFGWSNMNTWESAYHTLEKDYLGNASLKDGNIMVVDASNCMISAPKKKLVVLQGLDQYIIVDTGDVLMICERGKENQIKNYIAEIRRNKGDKFL